MAPRYQYPHHAEMPYAHEPWKTLYTWQRLFTTLVLTVWWALYYTLAPRRARPRESWSLKCIIAVNFTRRVYAVTERAGVTWGTRNPDEACDDRTLRETRFVWVDPLSEELRTGVIKDEEVPFKRVGCFVWPKEDKIPLKDALPTKTGTEHIDDIESRAGDVPLIGIFLHGGGYCHMSAHEKAGTSRIPRRLMKDKAFTEIYAVEYRLLQHAPFPAAVQDAAAVYSHLVRRHQRPTLRNASSGASSTGTAVQQDDDDRQPATIDRADADSSVPKLTSNPNDKRPPHCKIVLIGDSAGGNLVLALARWIRDEGVLPPPDGLLLLSPSCDPSHAFPEAPSSYVPRPHASTDYLVDTPEPRALLQRTFLGHHPPAIMHSPYVSPASPRVLAAFYGDAFVEGVANLTIAQLTDDHRRFLRTLPSVPVTPAVEGAPTSLAHPAIAAPRGLGLFTGFPRACVVLGDAERLEREVTKLVGAMERDGVEVHTVWAKDAPHDVLMMGWWDEAVRDEVWGRVEAWVVEL